MKKTFTLITAILLTLATQAFDNISMLTVTSVSSRPIKILINGRSFAEAGNGQNEVVIRDIRPGYHYIKVYQHRQGRVRNGQQWNSNHMLKVLYEGRVYVRQGFHVDITINRFGKALVDEQRIERNFYGYDDDHYYNDDEFDWQYDGNFRQAIDSRNFDQLKQTIRNEAFDNTRLTIAKQVVGQHFFNTSQVKELIGLFTFESSKLDLAKTCYSRTIDKSNYFTVNDGFSFSNSKEELSNYIRTQQ